MLFSFNIVCWGNLFGCYLSNWYLHCSKKLNWADSAMMGTSGRRIGCLGCWRTRSVSNISVIPCVMGSFFIWGNMRITPPAWIFCAMILGLFSTFEGIQFLFSCRSFLRKEWRAAESQSSTKGELRGKKGSTRLFKLGNKREKLWGRKYSLWGLKRRDWKGCVKRKRLASMKVDTWYAWWTNFLHYIPDPYFMFNEFPFHHFSTLSPLVLLLAFLVQLCIYTVSYMPIYISLWLRPAHALCVGVLKRRGWETQERRSWTQGKVG